MRISQPIIDFYHIDSMEIIEYEPIHRYLPNSVMVAVPKSKWFDFERATNYFQERHLKFQTSPSNNPDCVITTQYHKEIELPEYKKSLTMRLMYSLTEKNFCHSKKASEPFDAVLVPGPYSKDIISKYTNAIVVGFPKYDNFFKGLCRKQKLQKEFKLDEAKKTILYLPTWAQHSSIDLYKNAIRKLADINGYNMILKPHTVTVRRERYRIDYFKKEIEEGKILCLEQQIGLDELFTVADIVIADGMGGAFWESILIANLPTLAIFTEGDFPKMNLERRIQEFAIVNNDPNILMDDLKKIENEPLEYKEKRREWSDELISFRDGTAGKRAAEEILNFIELKKKDKVFIIFRNIKGEYLKLKSDKFAKKIKSNAEIMINKAQYLIKRNQRKSFIRAIEWLKNNRIENKGIPATSKKRISYLEVTGYFIPTLYQWGEKEFAKDLALWLLTQQNENGSFSAADGVPYTFDTGQVIRGFLAVYDDLPDINAPLTKASDWILTQVQSDGRLSTPSTKMWADIADDRIHIYVLPLLIKVGKKLNEPKYIDAAYRVLEYYKHRNGLMEFNTLSHFYAYIIEGLCDLGERALAKEGMEQVAVLQRKDGSVPAYKDVSWVCSTGVAQFAVIGYKLGMREFANKAINYLERVQNRSGGFNGSYGRGASYFPKEEISWAAKFFLDAYYWKIKTAFNQEVDVFPESIEEKDGRVQEILSFLGDLNGKNVIDIGCGKGRFLRILKGKYPLGEFYALDISEQMLKFCPEGVKTIYGSILDIKYPDAYFDCVYCVEALEHAIRIETAIREMCRILKPGGKIIVIDKNKAKLGRLKIEPWEQWFNSQEITELLRKHGIEAESRLITYKHHQHPNGLFILWGGTKT